LYTWSQCKRIRGRHHDHGHLSRPGLTYYLTGEVSERRQFAVTGHKFDRLRPRRLHAGVAAFQLQVHQLTLAAGRRLTVEPTSGVRR
jgi:phosphate-selective porin